MSIFDLFTIGIGPSSSHSVGPMRASGRFSAELRAQSDLDLVERVQVELFGSLALTGLGHGSDKALLLGLVGETPERVDPETMEARKEAIIQRRCLLLDGRREIALIAKRDLLFHRRRQLPHHPNGLRFTAYDASGKELMSREYYSIGGGFVISAAEAAEESATEPQAAALPFETAADLMRIAEEKQCPISRIMLEYELGGRSLEQIQEGIDGVWAAMQACVEKGCRTTGILPGGLQVKRRAPGLFAQLSARSDADVQDPLLVLDWVDLWALAVNEENAAGGRVVTAPTNGAAGILPAVLHYYVRFHPMASVEGVRRFLLTAAAIAVLYRKNASISGAEVGCQGEVGVACSMAAGALTEVLGGNVRQVEQAAEIGMEHNLGLTCDPIGGLVQIPCIERNAMGAVKALNAARLVLRGDGSHYVSLDRVIEVMRRTGRDMSRKYKETSLGGLAVNVTEC